MLPFEPPRSGCSKTHYWSPTVRRNDQSISEADLIKPFKAVITRILSSCFCFSANQPGSQSLVIHSVWLSVSLVLSRTVSSSRSEWVSKCVCQSVSLFINPLIHYSVTYVVRNSMQVSQSVSQSLCLNYSVIHLSVHLTVQSMHCRKKKITYQTHHLLKRWKLWGIRVQLLGLLIKE